ncbi:head-tail connector protein [Aeribacillus pallidus]|uniref:head-tail connector protein n=1 Tax=Aeribacillus pallidus TaxID=33936 RepID=UPI003D25CAB7
MENNLEDNLIQSLKTAASNEAERFLNTDFSTTDETGQTIENEAPVEVKIWVLNRMAELYENRGRVPEPDFSMIQHLRVYPFNGEWNDPEESIDEDW